MFSSEKPLKVNYCWLKIDSFCKEYHQLCFIFREIHYSEKIKQISLKLEKICIFNDIFNLKSTYCLILISVILCNFVIICLIIYNRYIITLRLYIFSSRKGTILNRLCGIKTDSRFKSLFRVLKFISYRSLNFC